MYLLYRCIILFDREREREKTKRNGLEQGAQTMQIKQNYVHISRCADKFDTQQFLYAVTSNTNRETHTLLRNKNNKQTNKKNCKFNCLSMSSLMD